MLSSCVCPSVRPSHAGIFFETTGRIEVVFGMWAIFTYPVQFLQRNWDTSVNTGTTLWNFAPNSGLGKFRHGKSIALSTTLLL